MPKINASKEIGCVMESTTAQVDQMSKIVVCVFSCPGIEFCLVELIELMISRLDSSRIILSFYTLSV